MMEIQSYVKASKKTHAETVHLYESLYFYEMYVTKISVVLGNCTVNSYERLMVVHTMQCCNFNRVCC